MPVFSRIKPLLLLLLMLLMGSQRLASQEVDSLAIVSKYLGWEFSAEEVRLMRADVKDQVKEIRELREFTLPNSTPPALQFNPLPQGYVLPDAPLPPSNWNWEAFAAVKRPVRMDDLAFYSIMELAQLVKTGQVSSLELTEFFIQRLKTYGDTLECVITLTEEYAYQQARKADAEIAAGAYKGPLHGIPYGVKDLLSFPGYPTTWGAMPYKDQVLDETATVIQRLEDAGGIMIAKLTLGALAWGDVWYGGTTRNPWNPRQGSSGSSAGSASATAAGLVPYSIGTETLGSIISPSTRCGTSGLRPTYGRVSRYGAMALSWSMDKIGPICKSAEDCALVFAAIQGKDPLDASVFDLPFSFDATQPLSELEIGYAYNLFDSTARTATADFAVLAQFKEMGIELIPLKWEVETNLSSLGMAISVEGAAAFETLTRTKQDSLMVRQIRNAWPNVFRAGQMIPAVAYVQAQRHRYNLIQETHALMKQVDVLIVPSFSGNQLFVTNLTGHPALVMPHGFDVNGAPMSITFLSNLYDEAKLLRVGQAWQQATEFEDKHPKWLE